MGNLPVTGRSFTAPYVGTAQVMAWFTCHPDQWTWPYELSRVLRIPQSTLSRSLRQLTEVGYLYCEREIVKRPDRPKPRLMYRKKG
jgi:hypothetical protein